MAMISAVWMRMTIVVHILSPAIRTLRTTPSRWLRFRGSRKAEAESTEA